MNDNLSSNKNHSEYYAALQWLLERPTNPKFGLSRMNALLALMNLDLSDKTVVQVVGTNGKGSTVAFLESLFKGHDISVGLFTSPHLCSARERIRINKEMVSPDDFVSAVSSVQSKITLLDDEPSFFECILAMALEIFCKAKVKVIILEAGLGGRLDATTAVKSSLLGVSMIDFDHQALLGATIKAIAYEKIAAAHKDHTVISMKQCLEADEVIKAHAKDIGFTLHYAKEATGPLGLFGEHQQSNAGLALELFHRLTKGDENIIRKALLEVSWPGRFHILFKEPPVVLDGAHNPSGIHTLIHSLKNHPLFKDHSLDIIYGSLNGANVQEKIDLLVKSGLTIRTVYLHHPDNPRAIGIAELHERFIESGLKKEQIFTYKDMAFALKDAKKHGSSLVVCGSLYTVGAIFKELNTFEHDPKMPDF